MSDLPPITGVSGGIGGLEAQYAALLLLAAHYDEAGDRARHWAALGPVVVADGDLLASAVLSPGTFARAEAAVLRATAGPDGALGRGVAWELEGVAVREAVSRIIEADAAVHDAIEVRDYALGRAAGSVALGTVLLAPPLTLPLTALAARLGALDGLCRGVQLEAVAHPGVVEALFNGGGGLVDGLDPFGPVHPDTAAGADTLAGLYDDGRPQVTQLSPHALADLAAGEPEPVPVPDLSRAPTSLAGLLTMLGGVAGLSHGATSRLNGTIAVTTLTGPDGSVRHIVYVPGTDDLATTPLSQDHDVRDMGTNLDLMAGRPTSYGEGVLEAMHRAGVGAHEPVLLVGHSQGGMVSAALAGSETPYDISHVVTAGAPTAQVHLPEHVHTVSLENVGDIVPLTDGEPNHPGVGQVTVSFAGGGDGLVGHHAYAPYVAGAGAADASTDPSIVAALDDLHVSGFLGGGPGVHVESHVFQVTRG